MSAWLFTILRNLFRSEYRKRRREVEDADGFYAESLTSLPDQYSHLRTCLALMSREHREIIDLVYYREKTVDEAADLAASAIKQKLKRQSCFARSRLTLIKVHTVRIKPTVQYVIKTSAACR
jgi:RNA polymerase sigma-70 factor (ECF subfamily)